MVVYLTKEALLEAVYGETKNYLLGYTRSQGSKVPIDTSCCNGQLEFHGRKRRQLKLEFQTKWSPEPF